eukprot:TRINITY_DN1587_c0_g1_i1.p1 TRINITY_DN1587_c0_g1~~TRINITY_DN1587_c0_g1_i1.p1  ORF type:complete len:171 (+),score=34.65 TRINITY_DN1587_c0_g1_i1:226-738(+)
MEDPISAIPPGKGVILFDGVCNVCNGFVNFVLDRDAEKHFVFASLQSDIGQKLCTYHGIPVDLNTMVLIEGDAHYIKSSAFLRVFSRLSSPWPGLFYAFYCIPPILRDTGYSIFAKYRYALFGQEESCRMMTPELKQRFLEYASKTPQARPKLDDSVRIPIPAISTDKTD